MFKTNIPSFNLLSEFNKNVLTFEITVAPYQPFDMSNPRLDTPMMMNQDDMLAIEADRPSYPALMNGINNVTTSCMTPYGNTGYEEIQRGIHNYLDFINKMNELQEDCCILGIYSYSDVTLTPQDRAEFLNRL